MSDRDHPVDRLIRALAGPPPTPTEEEYLRTEAAVNAAIAEEQERIEVAARRRPHWMWMAAAVVALVLASVVVFRPGVSAASAAMEEIVFLADPVDPADAPDGSFLMTQSENLSVGSANVARDFPEVPFDGEYLTYQWRYLREMRYGFVSTVQLTMETLEYIFSSPGDEAVFNELHLEADQPVGKPLTVTQEDPDREVWPEDKDELDDVIRSWVTGRSGEPFEVEYLDVALQIVWEKPVTPELRASVLSLIGEIDGLQLTESEIEGVTVFYLEYDESGGVVRQSFGFDDDGYLRFFERRVVDGVWWDVPAGTIIFQSIMEAPVVVDSLRP